MGTKPVRIGIIGCGRVAENHAKAISSCRDAKLVGAAGGRKAKEFCDRHGITMMPLESIYSSPDIDALLVLTPPQSHFEYAINALKANKHVLVEKPISFVPEQIQALELTASHNGLVCMPGHSYIYLPELARIKRAAQGGDIGQPYYLYMSEVYYMPPDLFLKYQGPEIDVLCHQLYMALAFLGIPEKLSAFRTNFSKDIIETGGPQVSLSMKYKDGALAQCFVSWSGEDYSSDPWTFKVKLLGSRGAMHFSRRDYTQNVGTGYEQALYQEMFDQQMNHFVHTCILEGGTPLSTMSDAFWTCRLHNLVMESIETGQTVVISQE